MTGYQERKVFMKKLIKLAVLSMIVILAGGINADAAKKITVNKSKVTVKVGKTAKVRTNVKNVKVKSSKIVKVTVKGKVVSIKGVKAGKAKVKFTAKKMKSKTIKVTVKKVKNLKGKKVEAKKNEKKDDKKETEESIKEKIDGYGDSYKNDIESYPYLDKTSFSKLSEDDKTIQNKMWQAMPDYLRDCLAYNKVIIIYADKISTGGHAGLAVYGKNNSSKITLTYYKNFSLIHEAAHIYDHFNSDFNVDVKINANNEFSKNPNKYGSYGSTNLTEFYAEHTSRQILKNVVFFNDEDLYNFVLNNCTVEKSDPANRLKYVNVEFTLNIPYIKINEIYYQNGMKKDDLDKHINDLVKNHFESLYPGYEVKIIAWPF